MLCSIFYIKHKENFGTHKERLDSISNCYYSHVNLRGLFSHNTKFESFSTINKQNKIPFKARLNNAT